MATWHELRGSAVGLLRRRRGSLASLAVGALVVATVGSVLAVASDSLIIARNEVQTGSYDSPGPRLAMAVKGPGDEQTPCNGDLRYSEDDALDARVFSADLQAPIDWSVPGVRELWAVPLCLKNTGAVPGQLTLITSYVLDRELGEACRLSEREAGDRTCNDLGEEDIGELSPLLRFSARSDHDAASEGEPGVSASCTSSSGLRPLAFEGGEAPLVLDVDLAPGETCEVGMAVSVFSPELGSDVVPDGFPLVTETDKLLSQTDTTSFDLVFSITPA
jgi:hypothetical protein